MVPFPEPGPPMFKIHQLKLLAFSGILMNNTPNFNLVFIGAARYPAFRRLWILKTAIPFYGFYAIHWFFAATQNSGFSRFP